MGSRITAHRNRENPVRVLMQLFGMEQETATSDDYYTPSWLFEDMQVVFDLDVAAPPGGVPWIPAKRFLTMADDGLSTPWEGRVWMNPPYSESTPWANKFREHGNGIALMPFAKAGWMFDLWSSDGSIALLPTRTRFVSTDDGSLSIMLPVALWAFGDWAVEAINKIGHVR